MTIKDGKLAAQIAASGKDGADAWFLIGLSLHTGIILKPRDMAKAAYDRGIRYLEKIGAAEHEGEGYKLCGPLFGEKKSKPKRDRKPEETWRLTIVEKGGTVDDIIKAIPESIPAEQALFYRTELTEAYGNPSYAKYRRIVGAICGWVKVDGGYTPINPLKNILAMKNPIAYKCMAYPLIAKAHPDFIEEKLHTMENHHTVVKGERSNVALTLLTFLKPKPWDK